MKEKKIFAAGKQMGLLNQRSAWCDVAHQCGIFNMQQVWYNQCGIYNMRIRVWNIKDAASVLKAASQRTQSELVLSAFLEGVEGNLYSCIIV